MNKQIKFLLWSVCFVAGLAGCGSGSKEAGNAVVANATGRATFTVTWPDRSRLIPEASNSIRVEVKNGANSVASSLLSRPAQGGTSSATFPTLPVGNLTLSATAFPQADGTGTAQATATIPLVIQAGQDTPFSLTMASTIDRIELAPTVLNLSAGLTAAVTAAAKNANGAVVLLTSARIQWSSSNASAATVSSSGLVTAVAAGTAQVRFTDTESGKFGEIAVTVRPNNPIRFTQSATYPVPAGVSISSADFDGDGNLDIAASGNAEIAVLYGRGDGTFDTAQQYAAPGGRGVYARHAADINNDNRPDILCTDSNNGRILVFVNQGGRNFNAPRPYSFANYPTGIATGDLNGDGFRDLILGNFGDGDHRIGVLLNTGNGSFGTAVSYGVNSYPGSVDAADIDGDGRVDVVANAISSTVGQSSILVLWGNGDGTLTYGPSFATGTSNNGDARIVDINGDGRLDLFINNTFSNSLSYVINGGGRNFAAPITVGNVGGYPRQPAFADFNGDGLTDIVVANRSTIYQLRNLGNDLFDPTDFPSGGPEAGSLAIGDFNRDGKPDLIVADQNENLLRVFLNITS